MCPLWVETGRDKEEGQANARNGGEWERAIGSGEGADRESVEEDMHHTTPAVPSRGKGHNH